MAIVKRKKGILSTETRPPVLIINVPDNIKNELEYLDDTKKDYNSIVAELEKQEERNIKLALSRKELQDKYNQLMIEYKAQIKIASKHYNELKELMFKFTCPELNKEISIVECNKACKDIICVVLYGCSNRVEAINNFFQIL